MAISNTEMTTNDGNRPIKTVVGHEPYLIFEWPEGVPLPPNYIDGAEQLLGGEPSRNSATSDSPTTDATVKWFNSEKGFGFVALADGSGDAFLHVATLEAAGFDALEPGTKLRVQAGQGPKGRQVTAVLEVSSGPPIPVNRTAMRDGSDIPDQSDSAATEVHGTVKWFNSLKGFGFVGTEDGGKDVFVHITLLEKEGLREIAEGQKVVMRVQQRQKGREAISIKVMP